MAGKSILLPLHEAVAGAESWSPLDVTSATGWLCLALRYHIPRVSTKNKGRAAALRWPVPSVSC